MPVTGIEIRGYNRVENKLRRLASDLSKEVDPIVREWTQEERARFKRTPYPPKPPRSKYVRTGRLANSFAVRKESLARYIIENRAPYSSYVIGDNRGENQAWMHRGRWWLMRPMLEEHAPDLTRRISNYLRRMWEER